MSSPTNLVADRFLMRDADHAVDLASGLAVVLRRRSGEPRTDAQWAEACGELANLRHPALCSLLDYGPSEAGCTFEAWHADGCWHHERAAADGCAAIARASLHACGLMLTVNAGAVYSVSNRPAAIPDFHGTGCHSGSDTQHSEAALGAVSFNPPAAAMAVSELLSDAGRGAARVFSVWANDPEDVAWAQLAIARAVRRHGVIPVCVEMWREAQEHVRGRTVCLLSPAPAAESWAKWLEISAWSSRAVMLVCAEAGPSDRVVMLPSPECTFDELVASVRPRRLIADRSAAIRRAARQAQGSPARFYRALSGERPSAKPWVLRSGPSLRVSEQMAKYGDSAERPEPVLAGRWPLRGELVVLRSRMRLAVEQIDHGRHVAGARALRQVVGALSRRRDHSQAVIGMLDLARLHIRRGELKPAKAVLADASASAAALGRHDMMAHAAVLSGQVALNDLRLDEAESLLRTALIASGGLGEQDAAHAAAHGLARCLFWRGRFDEASAILTPLADAGKEPGWAVRLAIVRSNLAVAKGDLSAAITIADRALACARADATGLLAEAAVALAFCHLAVGDIRAVRDDVRVATAAARRGHDPLCAVSARLLGAEAERRSGNVRGAGLLVSRLCRVRQMPPLLRAQAAWLSDMVRSGDERETLARHIRLTGLEALSLYVPAVAPALAVRHVVGLLECCQAADEDLALLRGLCERLGGMLNATATAFFLPTPAEPTPVASSGGRVGREMAERVMTLAGLILPHTVGVTIEGGAPVRYAGQVVGALVARWPAGASPPARDCGALMTAAAMAAAPALAAVAAARRLRREQTIADDELLLGSGPAIEAVRRVVARAASAPFPVLIEGESGCGKELAARSIHRQSARRERPLVVVNCAALPDDLVESELFGHARGAFTGALADRPGVFEAAHHGTLFLDEVGELSPRAQAKLLRTVQEGEVRRVGENVARRVDVRLIAATNRDLRAEAERGVFRVDLLYRLDVIRVVVPPLRDRREDIAVLADALWRAAATRVGSRALLATATLARLARYDWPGNVRELQNVLAALAVQAPRAGLVGPAALPPSLGERDARPVRRLDEARRAFEGEFVRSALARAGGHRRRAAEDLGVTRQGLTKIIARHGLNGGGAADAVEGVD